MKPLTDEQVRILRAAQRGAVVRNEHDRWVIDGERRPDRKDRERLTRRGLLDYARREDGGLDWDKLDTTAKADEVLAEVERSRSEAPASTDIPVRVGGVVTNERTVGDGN